MKIPILSVPLLIVGVIMLLMSAPVGAFYHGTPFNDGSAGAPSGTPPAPGLFNQGTGGVGTTYPFRPPWNVAGVDYYVGNDSGVSLVVPNSGNVPACAAVTSTVVVTLTVSGTCTFQGFDMTTLGGFQLIVNSGCSGTLNIKNNKFLFAAGFASLFFGVNIQGPSTCNINFTQNILDGDGCNFANLSTLLAIATSGLMTITYNQFLNSPQHGVSQTGSAANGNQIIVKYNYFRNLGFASGAHANPTIYSNTASNWNLNTYAFNTYVNSSSAAAGDTSAVGVCAANAAIGGNGITAFSYITVINGQTLTNTTVDHNTYVAAPSGTPNFVASAVGATTTGTTVAPVVSNNYLGSLGSFGSGVYNFSAATSPQVFNNINMANGAACNIGC